ncbi:hypothetical protein PFDG_00129 [Plasmodium falciparum Dd2]|uniref:Uncharacterized protein n=1 Tax=Plasmodium falciparum (isolate Dd2) TaxID=57267 RepID=A0A0L7LWB2_PLAF4|nr:hypothetical protein PFDG_00129 [Plasmodium falciparum Dd2]
MNISVILTNYSSITLVPRKEHSEHGQVKHENFLNNTLQYDENSQNGEYKDNNISSNNTQYNNNSSNSGSLNDEGPLWKSH